MAPAAGATLAAAMTSLLLPLLTLGGPALANGQSTHIWITLHALEHLPEGELKDLLTDPALEPILINGAMFPDGGYPLGDDYAEIAHWEPFQNRYRDWIRTQYGAPWTDEGEQHVAFLMGMASHGMADQTFDALFYERGLQHDHASDFGTNSFDTSTDVVWMSMVGPMEYPQDWVPYDTFVQLYAEVGHSVSADTLATGQNLLRVAVLWVGNTSQIPDEVDRYAAQFPWMNSHLDDPEVSGNPPCEGRVLAEYWQSVWRRLNGDMAFDPEIIATFPEGGYGLDTDPAKVESRISLVFSQAMRRDSLADDKVVVTDPSGSVIPTTNWLYYGDNSHVLHLASAGGWAADTAYTVTVGPGLMSIDGNTTSGEARFTVSTEAPPPSETDTGSAADSGAAEDDGVLWGGGCGSRAGLLGFGMLPLLARRRRTRPPG